MAPCFQVSQEFKYPEGSSEEDMGAAGDGDLIVVLDLVPDAELLQVQNMLLWGIAAAWHKTPIHVIATCMVGTTGWRGS